MTETIHPKNSVRRWYLIVLAGWFVGCGLINEAQSKENTKTIKNMTFWHAIQSLEQQVPFTKAKVERLFSTTLIESNRSTHTTSFEGSTVEIGQDRLNFQIDLRLGNEANDPGFLALDISGACIKLDQVRSHYGEMQITGIPHGHSLDEVTSYTAMRPWGELSFSFTERNPDCLDAIAFDPSAMK